MAEEFDVALSKGLGDFLGQSLALTDPADKKAFQSFSEARVSKRMLYFTMLLTSMFVIYFFTLALVNARLAAIWPIIIAVLIVVLFRQPLFVCLFCLRRLRADYPNGDYWRSWIPLCVNLLTVVSTICLGCFFLARVYNGKCRSLKQIDMWSCNSELDSRALPQEHLMMLMLCPVIHATVLKHLDFKYIWVSWVLVVCFLFTAVGMADATQSLPAICVYIPVSAVILLENHRQDLILYFVVKRQRKLLVENQQMSEDTATELRHMIANVAHDLKTPLSGFMSGVESISTLMESLEVGWKTNSEALNLPFNAGTDLAHIRENLENLINTNNFMLMTINRCIDYTKASKGLKLDPRLETVNLAEILALPIQVMKDMQHRISVNLLSTPPDICTHIITDKQWLQENLFCLISNAVKYSSNGGTVSIGMSITKTDRLPQGAKRELKPLSIGITPSGRHKPASLDFSTSRKHSINHPRSRQPSSYFSPSRAGSARVFASSSSSSGGGDGESDKSKTSSVTHLAHLSIKHPSPLPAAMVSDVLLFEIEDTGIGVSEETMAALFTPFKQAQRRAGGTGLGLYSLAKRVEALGGYYGVQRRKDGREGSLFWFAIPYTPDLSLQLSNLMSFGILSSKDSTAVADLTAPPSGKLTPTSSKTPQIVGVQKLNILIVDDSLTILKMSSMMLKRQGHNISQAENGAEALQKIAAGCGEEPSCFVPFDIVLMDLNMPVMDGLEATTRLRALETANKETTTMKHQFVVGFSANSDHDTMLEAYAAGVDDFICKPFALQTFYNVYNKYQLSINSQNI